MWFIHMYVYILGRYRSRYETCVEGRKLLDKKVRNIRRAEVQCVARFGFENKCVLYNYITEINVI